MYTEESLKEELLKKLGKEQMKYIDIVKEKGINYAIDNAYKITARQAIIDYFSNSNISPKDIKALLNTENLLDDFYREWLHYDGNFYDALEYPIQERLESLSDEYYNNNDKNVEQENKSTKTKNKARDCR